MNVRTRIGLMMPAADATTEPDLYTVLGTEEFSIHTHRLWDAKDLANAERMDRMNSEIESAARYLARAGVDAIAYCCTTGSFYRGSGWDQEMLQIIESAAGVPAVATSPSVVEALHHIGAKKLSVITPYPTWNNERLEEFLTAKGFEVLHVDAHPKPSSGAILAYDQDPDEILEFGIEKCRPEADVLFCSCTDWRALEAAERLEASIGKPVVTSNQATIWAVLRKLGVTEPIYGFGRLLQNLVPSPSAS